MIENRALAAVAFAIFAAGLSSCASVSPSRWLPQSSCDDVTLPIYFQEKSDVLTAPAQQALVLAAEKAKSCRVTGVEVLGLSDARDASPELSQLRAEAVSRALMAQGLSVPRTDALGDVTTRTRDGRTQPMQRRTEVVIHLAK